MTCPRSIALVAPNPADALTGNEVSAQRLRAGLVERGLCIEFVRPEEPLGSVLDRMRAANVELVNAFHAWRTGPRARRLAERLGLPYVVTITGTDVALHAHDAERGPEVRDVLRNAAAILCGYEAVLGQLERLGAGAVPAFVIPKGVALPELSAGRGAPPDGDDGDRLLVLQSAHLRPVKNNLLAVRAVRRLADAGRPVRLVLLGDVLDAAYAGRLEAAAGGPDAWSAIWRPAVPHDRVGAWYAAADIVLNTSDSEGGSNAILEAMAHRRAVVASDVAGNAAFVGTDGTRGLLYPVVSGADGGVVHDEDALVALLGTLADEAALRDRLGAGGRAYVAANHAPGAEIEAVLRAYAAASD